LIARGAQQSAKRYAFVGVIDAPQKKVTIEKGEVA